MTTYLRPKGLTRLLMILVGLAGLTFSPSAHARAPLQFRFQAGWLTWLEREPDIHTLAGPEVDAAIRVGLPHGVYAEFEAGYFQRKRYIDRLATQFKDVAPPIMSVRLRTYSLMLGYSPQWTLFRPFAALGLTRADADAKVEVDFPDPDTTTLKEDYNENRFLAMARAGMELQPADRYSLFLAATWRFGQGMDWQRFGEPMLNHVTASAGFALHL